MPLKRNSKVKRVLASAASSSTRLGSARPLAQPRAAFGLVEIVISTLITSVLLTAALRTLSAAKRREMRTVDQSLESLLAEDLLHEILQQRYADAEQPQNFGPEPGEQDGTRIAFDDVDDYHGLQNQPPQNRDGTVLTQFPQLLQSVSVQWVSAIPPHNSATSETGMKRITVSITRDAVPRASAVGYRSSGFPNRIQP